MEKLASFTMETSAGVEECFEYLSNMVNFGTWFPEVAKIVSKNDEPIGIGKQYIETAKIPLVGDKQITITVKEYVSNEKFSTEGDFFPLFPRMEVSLSEMNNGKTAINWAFYSRNKNKLFKFFLPLFRSILAKRARIGSDNLHNILVSAG